MGRLLVILFLLSLHTRLRNTVKIPLAGLCDAASALLLILLQHANLLQRLHHFPIDTARGIDVVAGAGATVLGATVDLS